MVNHQPCYLQRGSASSNGKGSEHLWLHVSFQGGMGRSEGNFLLREWLCQQAVYWVVEKEVGGCGRREEIGEHLGRRWIEVCFGDWGREDEGCSVA